jgi:hypothetical protein
MRFSLRALMIFVTLICIFLGSVFLWYRAQQVEFERQKALSQQLGQLGADVSWSDQTPYPLKWIGNWGCFQRIDVVGCPQPEHSDTILDLLGKLPRLRAIWILGRNLNDDFLHKLLTVKGLEQLIVVVRTMPDQEALKTTEIQQVLPRVSVEVTWVD